MYRLVVVLWLLSLKGHTTSASINVLKLESSEPPPQTFISNVGRTLSTLVSDDAKPQNIHITSITKNKVAFRSVDNKKLRLKVPKCCAFENSIFTPNGCEERPTGSFEPTFKVYDHNKTYFNNEPLNLDLIAFETKIYIPECGSNIVALDERYEEFAFLKNGSLLIKGQVMVGILSDRFCLDNDENGTKIFVCLPENNLQKASVSTYVYATFNVISIICSATTFLVYSIWVQIDKLHKKFFLGYVFAMTITSITVVPSDGCETLGFFFQFFMVATLVLQAIISFDLLILVKCVDESNCTMEIKRTFLSKVSYFCAALLVPVVSVILTLSRSLTPNVPDSFFQMKDCYFHAESQKEIYFYIPISISIAVTATSLILTKLKIIEINHKHHHNYTWSEEGLLYRQLWTKYLIIFLTSFMWIVEAMLLILFGRNCMLLTAVDVVKANQGFIVFLLFVLNKQTRNQIWRSCWSTRKKKSVNIDDVTSTEELLCY